MLNPNRFFGSGMAARLGPSAAFIYLALCDQANRNSNVSFKASEKALASETTIAPRTICNARKKLIEFGLISCKREKGRSHVYTLLKPFMGMEAAKGKTEAHTEAACTPCFTNPLGCSKFC